MVLNSHTIVIGGSIAGILAACVLSKTFQQVTIIERDKLSIDPNYRSGTPQSRHVHILLSQGKHILETLFPNIEKELIEAGGHPIDWIEDCRILNLGGWMPRFASDQHTISVSRPLLEWSLRKRLQTFQNVNWLEHEQVVKYIANESNKRITGVRLASGQSIYADLIVDASGRTSQTPQQLQELGLGKVKETIIDTQTGYATCWYRQPDHHNFDWDVLGIRATPPSSTRTGMIFPVEGKRWAVTLIGSAGDYPPTNEAEFLDFAKSLPSHLLFEAIQLATPLTPIYGYRKTNNILRHYEQFHMLPDGLIILGDAVCALNPTYGQGMTVAARGAMALKQSLDRYTEDNFTKDFQKKLAKANYLPWLMSTYEDFRIPGVTGSRPNKISKMMHWYIDKILQVCPSHANVYLRFVQTVQMTGSPVHLLRPSIIGSVLRHAYTDRQ